MIYDSINKILLKNNILAPKLLSENYSKNYIEIEDFGNKTIFTLLRKNGTFHVPKKIRMFLFFGTLAMFGPRDSEYRIRRALLHNLVVGELRG